MPQIAPYQKIVVGDVTVTFLPDGGGIVTPEALYPASTTEAWQQYDDLLNEAGKFITSIGAFLIETNGRKIAVDLGIGPVSIDFPGFGPFSGGQYRQSLAQTGVPPTAVTDVIFTHLHLDHCGWTTIEQNDTRSLLFPEARYHATKSEWDFWYGGDNPAGPHPEFVQKPLADRIEFFQDGDELAPGITAVATPGHTPGHSSLLIHSGQQRLFLTADVFHGVMQLQEPDWSVAFDVDAEQARKTREGLYSELTKPNTLVAVNHFSNHAIGTIAPAGSRYKWQPIS